MARRRRSELLDRLPDDWLESTGGATASSASRRQVPAAADRASTPDGRRRRRRRSTATSSRRRSASACAAASSYGGRQTRDFGKLRDARRRGPQHGDDDPRPVGRPRAARTTRRSQPEARKLLSFTDNRQDASLQAGHFNDFVEVGLLRSALYTRRSPPPATDGLAPRRARRSGSSTRSACRSSCYASDPDVQVPARRRETERGAARRARLPPLPRPAARLAGHLAEPRAVRPAARSRYAVARRALRAPRTCWRGPTHPALVDGHARDAASGSRRVLLDFMRRELAIKVDYLDADLPGAAQAALEPAADRARGRSTRTRRSTLRRVAVSRARGAARDDRGDVYLSPRGGFGQYLRRRGTFPLHRRAADARRTASGSSRDLLEALRGRRPGRGRSPTRRATACPGYQLAGRRSCAGSPATARARSTTRSACPQPPDGRRPDQPVLRRLLPRRRRRRPGHRGARAHRPGARRGARGARGASSATATLPVLFCSPTMELGVDIAELNVVNLRNVPPTPANYAQRSGRAGRSGQPALVLHLLLDAGSPHDQYFFRRPRADGRRGGRAAAARPRQRGPGPRPRPRDLAGRDRAEPRARR